MIAVTPDLDLTAVRGFRYVEANGSLSLLSSARPDALWSEDIVEAGDSDGYAVIPHERQVQSLAQQLLPAILAVRRRRVRRIFRAVWALGIALVVLGVNAC